jgi:hypothetical protein
MKLHIDQSTIELLTPPQEMTQPQQQTYDLLLALARIGNGRYSLEAVVRWLGLQSPLPFWSRIDHLQSKGAIVVS